MKGHHIAEAIGTEWVPQSLSHPIDTYDSCEDNPSNQNNQKFIVFSLKPDDRVGHQVRHVDRPALDFNLRMFSAQ